MFSYCCVNSAGQFRFSSNKYITTLTFMAIAHMYDK